MQQKPIKTEKEDLITKIYSKLGMIQTLCKLSHFATEHESGLAESGYIYNVFEDIDDKCDQVYNFLDALESLKTSQNEATENTAP